MKNNLNLIAADHRPANSKKRADADRWSCARHAPLWPLSLRLVPPGSNGGRHAIGAVVPIIGSPAGHQTKNHQKMPIIKLNQSASECSFGVAWGPAYWPSRRPDPDLRPPMTGS